MAKKTNTATQNTAPPAGLLAQYQDLLSRAQGQSQNGVAPFGANTGLQTEAYGSFAGIPSQYLPQAAGYAAEGAAPITGGQIANYENPFQSDVIKATEANINETNAEQQNQITGNAIAQGALGGNRVGVAQGELARQQGLANNATLAGLNTQNYGQALAAAEADRAAKAQAAGQFAGLEGTALQGAAAQLGAGTQQQSYANQTLQWPYQNLDWLSQIEGQTGPLEGGTTKTTQPAPNVFSQLLGAGLTLAGLPGSSTGGQGISSLMSMFGASRGGGIRGYAPGGYVPPPMMGGIAPPMAPPGTLPPSAKAASMVANAMAMAKQMKGGIGHFDVGGIVPQPVPGMFSGADWTSPQIPPSQLPLNLDDAGIGTVNTSDSSKVIPAGITASAAPIVRPGGIAVPPTATVGAAGAPQTAASPTPGIGQGQLLKAFLNRPGNQQLTAMGLGIMGGTSPFFGTNVGQGALQGMEMERQLAALNQQVTYQQGLLKQGQEKVDISAAKPVVIGHDPQTFQTIYGVPNPDQPGTYFQVDQAGNKTGDVVDGTGTPVSDGTSAGSIPKILAPTDPGYATTPVAGGSTSAAIDQGALSFITSGTMPTSGSRGLPGQMFQTAVRNRAAQIDPSGNLAANKTQLAALNKSLGAQTTYLNNTQRAFNVANTTLQSVLGWMKQNNINPNQFPDFNSLSNYASSKGLDVGPVRGFQSQIAQLRAEYAQVLARNGQLTDAVRSNAQQVIPDNISPKDLATVADRLNVDSTNAIKGANDQIAQIWGQINGIAGGGNPAAPATTPAAPAVTPTPLSAATVLGQYPNAKQAKDGNWYVEQPAGSGKYLQVKP